MTSKIPSSPLSSKDKTITFHRFPSHIWHDQNLSLHERVVLCRVWSFQNSTPPLQCYLSFSQWADELGCKRRHAITVLNSLIEKNLLSKQSRGTQANIWELVHTEHQQELASAYGTLPSVYTAPVLVHTEHHASVLYAPKKIIEDQLENQVEDHIVADAPNTPTSLPEEPSPKKPSLTWEAIKDQVSDTDYRAIERWITYRTNQHKKKKAPTPRSVQIAIKQQGQHLARAIDYSIGKGYEGIVLPDYIKNQPISRTGMTREQIAQLWEYGWRAFHPNDWDDPGPRPDWMTGWHTDVAKAASLHAFGKDWEDRIQKEPASNSNYLLGPWRRALEEITLPERHNHE